MSLEGERRTAFWRAELLHLLWCRQVDLRLRSAAGRSMEAWGEEFKALIREVRNWPHDTPEPPELNT